MKTPKQKIKDAIDYLLSENEEVTFADGFEEAFIGFARQFNRPFVVYDRKKCIKILRRDMSRKDAEEYFQFNVEGAWVGESTPLFLERI